MVGFQRQILYGTRDADINWHRIVAQTMGTLGFVRGVSCGVAFYHAEKNLSLVVHGDDFTFCGMDKDLRWIEKLMKTWFEIKVRAILATEERSRGHSASCNLRRSFPFSLTALSWY